MTLINGHLILEDRNSFKAEIRFLFQINLVDLKTDSLKNEGMMAET